MYSNVDKLTAVLTHWLRPMGDAVAQRMLGDKLSGINEWVRKFFPVSADYSVTNDLAFLVKPSVDMMMSPAISKMLVQSGVADCDIPQWADRLVSAMKEKVASEGKICLFDAITLSLGDIEELGGLISRNLPVEASTRYEVI